LTPPDEKDERIEKTIKVNIQRSEQQKHTKTDPAQIFFVALRVAMQSFLLFFAHLFDRVFWGWF